MMRPWHETGERPFITVLLDNSTPTEPKAFHCLVCGKKCFEYYTNVRIVMAGRPEFKQLNRPTLHECTRRVDGPDGVSRTCKTMYVIG